MREYRLGVLNVIRKVGETLDPKHACTSFNLSVDQESHTTYIELTVLNDAGLPAAEIERKYQKLRNALVRHLTPHSLKLTFNFTKSATAPMEAKEFEHFIASVEKISTYPESAIYQQHKVFLMQELKLLQLRNPELNMKELVNLCVMRLYFALWPTLSDLCVSNSACYKMSNGIFQNLGIYWDTARKNAREILIDYATPKTEYSITENNNQSEIVTLNPSATCNLPELTLDFYKLFRVIEKDGHQPPNINQIIKYRKALSPLLELIKGRLCKAEKNLQQVTIYAEARRNCEQFFSEVSREQVIGILGVDLKLSFEAFIEEQGDQHVEILLICKKIRDKYSDLAQKINFILSCYDKIISEITPETKQEARKTACSTLFDRGTLPIEKENFSPAIGSAVTDVVVHRTSNFTKESKAIAKAKEKAEGARNKSGATTPKPAPAEDPKENARDTPPIVLIRMDGREDILLNLNSGKDAQGRDIAHHVAPTLIDACYLLLTEGPYVIDERNRNAIVNSSGRDFLKKTGKGSNGPKLFASDLIGIKKADENNRLILAGIEITVLDKKYKLYFPVDNLDHGTWERRQSSAPDTMDYRARMMAKVSQISLLDQTALDDERHRPRANFSM